MQSVDALTQIKTLKNSKIQKEAIEVAHEWLNLKRVSEKSTTEVLDDREKGVASKSPIKKVTETISSKNNVFADLK